MRALVLVALLGLVGCGGGEEPVDTSCFGPPPPKLEGPYTHPPDAPFVGPVQVCP